MEILLHTFFYGDLAKFMNGLVEVHQLPSHPELSPIHPHRGRLLGFLLDGHRVGAGKNLSWSDHLADCLQPGLRHDGATDVLREGDRYLDGDLHRLRVCSLSGVHIC